MPNSVPSADELRDALHARGNRLPDELRRLGEALWDEPTNPADHAACLAALPTYVQAEAAGESVAARFPDVKRHLDVCETCSAEYADLLDVVLAGQEGRLSTIPVSSLPDFSFLAPKLPPARQRLYERVTTWTRGVLTALAPNELAHLPSIADAFFAGLDASTSPRTFVRVVREESAVYGSPLVAPRLLAATYATAQALTEEVSAAQYDEWLAQDTLLSELDARSRRAAQDLGMNDDQAAHFGRAFAEQIVQDPVALQEILLADAP